MKWIKRILTVLIVLALGTAGAWYFTAVPRAVTEAKKSYGWPSDDELKVLADHAGDPRVLEAAVALTAKLQSSGDCTAPRLATLDAIYARQPLAGSEGAHAAMRILNVCNHPGVKSWGKFSGSELAEAARWTLRNEFIGNGCDAVIAWLEEAKVPVSEDSMVAVAFSLGIIPRAAPYFQRGFPADGQPLTAEPRIPVAGDARLVTPVREALLQFTHLLPASPGITPALAEITRTVKVPISDEVIQAVLRLKTEGQAEVARNLFTQADAKRIRDCAEQHESWTLESGVLARIVDALGAGSDEDAESVVLRLALDVPAEWQPNMDTVQNESHIANAQRTLLGMGARGARAATRHVGDKHPEVRKVCIEVVFQNDRAHFVDALLAAGDKLGDKDVARALDLAKDDPRLIELQLRALGYPTLVGKIEPALLKLPAVKLVPALFGLIAHRTSFDPSEVDAYRHLLDSTSDSAEPTAQVLDEALARAGRPEDVYWLTKLLALQHLGKVGSGPAQRAVVGKFLADTSGYADISIKYKGDTGKELSRTPTRIYFATVAKDALEQMH